MMTDRTTARVVGSLFIVASVAGVVGLAIQQSVLDSSTYLSEAALKQNQVATGAILELVMGIAVIGIAIAIYPVLRRRTERLALGYVVARSIEAVIYVIGSVVVLTILTVSRGFLDAGSPDASHYQTLGGVLLAVRDWAGHGVQDAAVFCVGALILNYALYRASLVPRWLSVWGLVGASLYLAAGALVIYGLEPLSTPQVVLEAPLGVQEIVLAVWLIVKGFDVPTPALGLGKEPAPAQRQDALT